MRLSLASVLMACAASVFVAQTAAAQRVPGSIAPLQIEPDPSGLDLLSGMVQTGGPTLSIPAAPRLTYARGSDWFISISGESRDSDTGFGPNANYVVNYGALKSISFECHYGVCVDALVKYINTTSSSLIEYNFDMTLAYTGELYRFGYQALDMTVQGQDGFSRSREYYASEIIYPDGEVLSIDNDDYEISPQFTIYRPFRINSNTGYYLEFTYHSNTYGGPGWYQVHTASIYKSEAPTVPLARLTYSTNNQQVTDLGNRTWSCTPDCGNSVGSGPWRAVASLRLPGDSTDHMNAASSNGVTTTSLNIGGVQWNYAYSNLQWGMMGGYSYNGVVVTGPENFVRNYEIVPELQGAPEARRWNSMIKGYTDSLGRRTEITTDVLNRIVQIKAPEGNGVRLERDLRGNVIEKRSFAKPGSGLEDQVETASYNIAECSGIGCWRPSSTRDADGNQTDYVFNVRGQPVEVTEPADDSGIRRKTITEYTTAMPSRPTVVRVCGVATTCGTNEELRTEYSYWGATGLPLEVRQVNQATGEILRTCFKYDAAGNKISETQPLGAATVCP